MGGLHAERMERQLESEAGRAFMVETQKAKVRTCVCVCGLLSSSCHDLLWVDF